MPFTAAKWSINDRCNLRCPFCMVDEERREMSLDEQFKVIDKLHDMGVTFIDFFGKEVLYDKRMFSLIEYAVQYGMKFSFITNGLNLIPNLDNLIELQRAYGYPIVQTAVSYDFGVSRAFNIPLKHLRRAFARLFVESGITTELSLDLQKGNYDSVLHMVSSDFAKGYYVKPIIPLGVRSDYAAKVTPTVTDLEKFMRDLNAASVSCPVVISIPFQMGKVEIPEFSNPLITVSVDSECSCGQDLYISADGIAYGCGGACYKGNPYSCDFLSTDVEDIYRIITPPKGVRGCVHAS